MGLLSPSPHVTLPTSKITQSCGQPQGLGQRLGPNSTPPVTPGAAALRATGVSRRYSQGQPLLHGKPPGGRASSLGKNLESTAGTVACKLLGFSWCRAELLQGEARSSPSLVLNQHFISSWRPSNEVKHLQKGMGLICRSGPADIWGQWHHPPAYQIQGLNGSITSHVQEAAGCLTQVHHPSPRSETGGR